MTKLEGNDCSRYRRLQMDVDNEKGHRQRESRSSSAFKFFCGSVASQPSDTLWIGRLAQLVNIPDFRLLEIKLNLSRWADDSKSHLDPKRSTRVSEAFR
jgi:hypothetical protein